MNKRIENPIETYGINPSINDADGADNLPVSGSEGKEPPSRYESNSHNDGEDDLGSSDTDGREARQIRFLQSVKKQTNFVFLFGAAQRGKTVITSSIVNFLSSVEAKGKLSPFKLTHDATIDEGRVLLDRMRRLHREQRFPERTVLVGNNNEPIYVNIKFTPNRELDSDSLSMTFLEMPGDVLAKVDSPTGIGGLPASINAFMQVEDLQPAFVLITSPETAFDDDQKMVSFIDYITDLDPRFDASRFLLLITKWDLYQGALPIDEFVAQTMTGTYAKLYSPKHSIAAFSIGSVTKVDGKDFLKKYNSEYPKRVVNWLYQEFTGKPLYRRGTLQKIIDGFRRFG